MKWVLIILLTSGGRPAAASVEFNDRPACELALAEVEKRWGRASNYSFCTTRGTNPDMGRGP